jgi:hypothetical protein
LANGRSSFEELVVLDGAGRLQIPGDQRALAGIGRRAKIELVDGGILIRPSDDDRPAGADLAETSDVLAANGDAAYHSLYSAEPLPPTNGARNGKGAKGAWWKLWRKRGQGIEDRGQGEG